MTERMLISEYWHWAQHLLRVLHHEELKNNLGKSPFEPFLMASCRS